jgi:hypothetical protein
LQARLEKFIYEYFDLTEEEIALVEDTVQIFEPSSTPPDREAIKSRLIPTLKSIEEAGLRDYAEMLVSTLNSWRRPDSPLVEASATWFDSKPFVLFQLRQTKSPAEFRLNNSTSSKEALFERVYEAALQKQGRFEYPRTITFFDGKSIHILKPKTMMHWTRTAALNDADEIFAEVIRASRDKIT